jgi:hypothetical protein
MENENMEKSVWNFIRKYGEKCMELHKKIWRKVYGTS